MSESIKAPTRAIITIVGRPNVGKSTLYNRLTRSRDAIVDDQPGVTRDRMVGVGRVGEGHYWIVDTGGIEMVSSELYQQMRNQVDVAVEDSDAIILLADHQDGVATVDEEIATMLRQSTSSPVHVVINKAEGREKQLVAAEFYQLGFEHVHVISAKHGDGVNNMISVVLESIRAVPDAALDTPTDAPKLAIVGRPNVGKSTLVNALLGRDRMVVYDEPGTTRDSIFVPLENKGKDYILIDTAGVRKKSRVDSRIERFSVLKTLRAIELAQVVAVVLNAEEGIVDQDLRLLNLAFASGRSLMLLINKTDATDGYQDTEMRRQIDLRLRHLDNVPQYYISAIKKRGIKRILPLVDTLYASSMCNMSTGKLNRLIRSASEQRPPPMVGNHRIKMKFAHQAGMNPPHVMIHGNQLEHLPATYKRFLARKIEQQFGLVGTQVKVSFKTSENPYKETRRRNSKKWRGNRSNSKNT